MQRILRIAKSFSFIRATLILFLTLIFFQFLIIFPQPANNSSIVSHSQQLTLAKNPTQNLTGQSAIDVLRKATGKKTVEQSFKGVHLVESINTERGWELRAEEATGSDQNQWLLKKVKITFYVNEIPTFKVAGEVGEINGESKDLTIRGNVITESSSGYVFKTDELKYFAATKSLATDDEVSMFTEQSLKKDDFNLTGRGLEIFLATSKMHIHNDVLSSRKIGEQIFLLKSEKAELSNISSEAIFLGNVRTKFDQYTTVSPKAFFAYSANSRKIEEIILSQSVKFKSSDKEGSCNELKIEVIADRITLRGNPKIKYQEDEIAGDEIVITEKGRRVKINRVDQRSGKKSD